jgi:nucleotide-binding universal stress UspA family protein
VDGSAHSAAALVSAQEARLRRQPVLLVHAWDLHPFYDGSTVLPIADVEAAEQAVLQEAVDRLASLAPDVAVTSRLVQGRADTALIDASAEASLVVVGRHGGASAWLGPVVGHVATLAHCPVVAVPAGVPAGPRHRRGGRGRLAGVGGGDRLRLRPGLALGGPAARRADRDAGHRRLRPEPRPAAGRARAGRALPRRGARGLVRQAPEVPVEQRVTYGSPLPALREAARDAGLVVVGSHGRGAVLRFALGSVSSSLLRSAPCPVAVVRPAGHPEELPGR